MGTEKPRVDDDREPVKVAGKDVGREMSWQEAERP
jgi:hypothetical protein